METNDFIVKRIPRKFRPAVVIGAGVILQFTYGIVYTFGNLLPYLVSYLRWKVNPYQTNGSMIWLQSFMSGIPFSMLLGGYLEKKIGARMGALIGSLIYTGSITLSFFSIQKSYILLLMTFGIVASFGQGIAYNCVLIQAQKWLPNKIGLASGLIAAGFGCGAFLISPIQTKFINPNNYQVDSDGFFTQRDLLESVPYLFIFLGCFFGVLQIIGIIFIADPIPETNDEISEDISLIENPEEEKISIREAWNSSTFKLLFLTLYLNACWCQISSGLFKTYGMKFIKDDFFLATVASFAAATNCFSRILWGFFMDKTSYQVTMVIACTIGSALMWTLGIVRQWDEPNIYFLWICGMFSIIGATYTLIPSAVHKCFGGSNFGLTYGVVQLSLVRTFSRNSYRNIEFLF
ncbi:hypothetical protein FO519_009622 [Halicephalobus sp. NKZ332]|nr:hypothetical protein FO519_009622 [Halicephalobus sp. NKZ332]